MNIATFPMVADSVGSKAERTAHVCEAAQIGLGGGGNDNVF